jgi:hypothetical protein
VFPLPTGQACPCKESGRQGDVYFFLLALSTGWRLRLRRDGHLFAFTGWIPRRGEISGGRASSGTWPPETGIFTQRVLVFCSRVRPIDGEDPIVQKMVLGQGLSDSKLRAIC